MRKYMLGLIPAAILAVVFAALPGCDNESTADTVVIRVTGKVPIEFNWDGSAPACPTCTIYAQVYTGEKWGTFDYGPFDFDPDSITLENVLAGQSRDFTVWVTDASGEIIYRGVTEGVKVIADTTNDPVQVTLYGRGWHQISLQQPSSDWQLTDVKLAEEGYGWMAGTDNLNRRGVVFRNIEGAWSLRLPDVTSSSNWTLDSIAPGDDNKAWAVGEDVTNGKSIILRYDGSIWNDDVIEPASSCLFGVSFSPSGSIGYAVGELNSDGVLLKYPSSGGGDWERASTVSSVSFFDVVTFNNGDAIVGGKDNASGSGYLALWDDSAGSYSAYSAPSSVCSSPNWEINDVYAVSADDWWAAGACYDPAGSTIGTALHYTDADGLTVQALPSISGDWWLNGIWADSAGDAWAVGEGASSVVILNKSGGSWSRVTPDESSGDWDLSAVDFSPAGSVTWGYAVGRNAADSRGLAIKYPFPK